MTKFKYLFLILLATLAITGAAYAQTNIYLSGAPATRAIWNNAIYNYLVAQNGGSTTGIVQYATGGTFATANQIAITGGKVGGQAVTIYANWSGSTGGNQSVANTPAATIAALKIAYINPSVFTSSPSGNLSVTLDQTNLQYSHINLSDSYQTTVPFHGHVTITSPATDYVTLTEATPNSPAITGYKFVASNNAPARLSNITTNLAQQLFQNGSVPLAFFTGQNADEGINIYSVGRDISSGARYVLLAETAIGTANSPSLTQYQVNISGGAVSSYQLYPNTASPINLISFPTGNGGYPSFSGVLTALSATSNDATGYFVTYITDSDAPNAESHGAHELSWNGVAYGTAKEGPHGTAPSSIAEGQYTYWSYLHVYYNLTYVNSFGGTTTTTLKTFANGLSSRISSDTTTGAILTSDLQVSRSSDGGIVTQLY